MCDTRHALPLADCPDIRASGSRPRDPDIAGVVMTGPVVDLPHHPELTGELRRALDEDARDLLSQPEAACARRARPAPRTRMRARRRRLRYLVLLARDAGRVADRCGQARPSLRPRCRR